MVERIERHDYFLVLAQAAALRSTCPRLHVGAVLVRRGLVVSTGYNGSLPGETHCCDAGCLTLAGHCLRTIHAEANAMRRGRDGDTLYCTHCPCYDCLKLVIGGGVREIYYLDAYRPDARREAFLQSLSRPPKLVQRAAPVLRLECPTTISSAVPTPRP